MRKLLFLFLLCFLFIGFGCKKNEQPTANYGLIGQRIDKLLTDYESGKISREQFVNTVANGADTAAADLQAVTIDHVTVRVKDLAKSAKFYEDVFWHEDQTHNTRCNLLFECWK